LGIEIVACELGSVLELDQQGGQVVVHKDSSVPLPGQFHALFPEQESATEKKALWV